MLFTDAIDL